jgi:uncharacterized protein
MINEKAVCEVEKRSKMLAEENTKKLDPVPVGWIDLLLTERCNFKCDYCYISKTPKDMTFETAKTAIDWARAKSHGKLIVNFFGGEPFLCKDVMLQILDYIKNDDKIGVMCVTNGSIYDEDIVNALQKPGYQLQISLDGVKEAHNMHRQDFDIVYMNARKFLAKKKEVAVRPTITPQNVKYLSDSVKLFYEMGFASLMVQCVMTGEWDKDSAAVYRNQYKLVGNFFLDLLKQDRYFRITFIESTIRKILQTGEQLYTCMAGKTLVSVGPDGTVYPCHRFMGDDKFILGNVKDGDFDQAIFRDIKAKNLIGCDQCGVLEACHICIGANYDENKDILLPSAPYCDLIKIEYEETLRIIEVGKKIKKFRDMFIKEEAAQGKDNAMLSQIAAVVLDTAADTADIKEKLKRMEDMILSMAQVIADMSSKEETNGE